LEAERLAQFASSASNGIAVEASDASQQGDAPPSVLAGEKTSQKAARAFV